MRYLKNFIYFLLGVFIIFYGFAMICIFNPDITDAVAAFLYPDSSSDSDFTQAVSAETEPDLPEYDDDNKGHPNMENSERETSEWLPDEGLPDADLFTGRLEESEKEGMEEGITSEYIPPEQSAIIIPENVSGRNGFQQIQDVQEQIDRDTAEQLQRQLDTGYTGDGLEFDALYYC